MGQGHTSSTQYPDYSSIHVCVDCFEFIQCGRVVLDHQNFGFLSAPLKNDIFINLCGSIAGIKSNKIRWWRDQWSCRRVELHLHWSKWSRKWEDFIIIVQWCRSFKIRNSNRANKFIGPPIFILLYAFYFFHSKID